MALGRGLGALIASSAAPKEKKGTDDGGKVWFVPINKIESNSEQPRRHFAAEELADLAASIKEHGILQPILVNEKDNGGYEIIAGERRWRAAKIAQLPSVPVIVKNFADQQKLEVALVENVQRSDLNPVEEALAYRRLSDEFGLTQQQIAERVGKGRPTVANIMRVLDLAPEALSALQDQRISFGQAKALLSLNSHDEQRSLLSSMLGQKITVRDLEDTVRAQKGVKLRKDPNLAYLEDKLRQALNAKVNIGGKGERGVISIYYYSPAELKQIVDAVAE